MWFNIKENKKPNQKLTEDLKRHFSKEDIQIDGQEAHEIYSISQIIKEMQIKITLSYNLIPVRMAIIKKPTNDKYWWCGGKVTLLHCWWKCKLVEPL